MIYFQASVEACHVHNLAHMQARHCNTMHYTIVILLHGRRFLVGPTGPTGFAGPVINNNTIIHRAFLVKKWSS